MLICNHARCCVVALIWASAACNRGHRSGEETQQAGLPSRSRPPTVFPWAQPSASSSATPGPVPSVYGHRPFPCGSSSCISGETACCTSSKDPTEATCRPIRWPGKLRIASLDACNEEMNVDRLACTDSSDCAAGVCCTGNGGDGLVAGCTTDPKTDCDFDEVCRTSCRTPHTTCRGGKCMSTRAPAHLATGWECTSTEHCGDGEVCVVHRVSRSGSGSSECAFGASGFGDIPTHTCATDADCGDWLRGAVCRPTKVGPYDLRACTLP